MNESKYREPKNNPPLSLSKKEYENIKSFPIIKFYLKELLDIYIGITGEERKKGRYIYI